MKQKKPKVMVGMSGGVDSSVAALLLAREFQVCGATLKLHDSEQDMGNGACAQGKTCCSIDDVYDARQVCRKMGVEHFVFNFKEEFETQVVDHFIGTYQAGGTPNPCIDCNRYIKFSKMLERALLLEQDYIATGHYARVVFNQSTGRYALKKAVDETKDQSYVLYSLTQYQLAHLLLPLGTYTKQQIREIAAAHGFGNANKPDSQDICFVPDGDYAGFIRRKTKKDFAKGDFIDLNGKYLGTHNGLLCYTTGQRKGLGIASDAPLYVVRKDMEHNKVILGREADLYTGEMLVGDMNYLALEHVAAPCRVLAKTRYRQKEQPAVLYPADNDGRCRVVFDLPQRAVTAGQAAVFYDITDGETVLCGGTIL